MREEVIERVSREKIIAIVRGVGSEQCMKVAQALYDGGISVRVEIFPKDQLRT